MLLRSNLVLGLSALCLAAAVAPAAAIAGPCSDGIAELGRKLAPSASLGPVTTGTVSGTAPTASPQPNAPTASGTSADAHVGGTAGTKEANAAVGNLVATSSQDVRRQQEGLPTAAAVAAAGSGKSVETTPSQASSQGPDDRMSQAKMELEKARMLDQNGDQSCHASLDRTRQLMN